MSKLQNIKAIKQLLENSHRTQTKKSFFFDSSKVDSAIPTRKVGDRWVETSPDGSKMYCEQKQGYIMRSDVRWDLREKMTDIVHSFNQFENCYDNCEKKKTKDYTKNDYKFGRLYGRCMDCNIKFETELQIRGEYEDYVMGILRENLKSWIRDQEIELDNWARDVRDGMSYVMNGEGELEQYKMDNAEKAIEKMYEEWNEYKELLYKNYGVTELEEENHE